MIRTGDTMNRPPRAFENIAASDGFSMLEVLISILIVSFGLLGLAGLQTIGIKNAHAATQRTIASQLAYDMTDRMRANLVAVANGDYNYPSYSLTGAAGTSTGACLTTTGCTPTQLALQDIFEWNAQILAQLPQSTGATVGGVVCIDSTPNDGTAAAPACDNTGLLWVVKIWWLEDRNNAAAPAKLVYSTFEP